MRPSSARSAVIVAGAILAALAFLPGSVAAVEVGQPAPDFRLPATTGGQISLSQFRGKQPVLIEFYGVDFAPV